MAGRALHLEKAKGAVRWRLLLQIPTWSLCLHLDQPTMVGGYLAYIRALMRAKPSNSFAVEMAQEDHGLRTPIPIFWDGQKMEQAMEANIIMTSRWTSAPPMQTVNLRQVFASGALKMAEWIGI